MSAFFTSQAVRGACIRIIREVLRRRAAGEPPLHVEARRLSEAWWAERFPHVRMPDGFLSPDACRLLQPFTP